jgi:hypothetical protein
MMHGGTCIMVGFLKSERDHPMLNRITGFLGNLLHAEVERPMYFCHVELIVPYQGRHISSSIYQGETVSMSDTKTFSNPNYIMHCMTVTPLQLSRIVDFIRYSYNSKVGFDLMGMLGSMLPFPLPFRPKPSHRTFCSRYMVEALQYGDVEAVRGMNAATTSPAALYRKLTGNSNRDARVLGTLRSKMTTLDSTSFFACQT